MNEQELNDDGFDEDAGTAEAGSDGDAGAPPADKGTKDSGNSDKRINDLMSNWQSEQAKNAQLEARIKELEGAQSANDGDQKPSEDPQMSEFLQLARTQARKALFDSDPRLAKYGIEVDAIEGDSAEAMQKSLKGLTTLLDKVESSARTDAVRQFGLDPEIAAGPSQKPVDFGAMSDKEILELGDAALRRL